MCAWQEFQKGKTKKEDEEIIKLLEGVIGSFDSGMINVGCSCIVTPAKAGVQCLDLDSRLRGNDRTEYCYDMYSVGLPLGNLTSQLLVNIYMNEFDQYVKHKLKVRYYIRYADDFVFLSSDRKYLEEVNQKIEDFLIHKLRLQLHPDKVFIKTLASGVDFLGWVHFSHHKVLRTVTKKRMFRKVGEKNVTSYFGLLSHGNSYKLSNNLQTIIKNL